MKDFKGTKGPWKTLKHPTKNGYSFTILSKGEKYTWTDILNGNDSMGASVNASQAEANAALICESLTLLELSQKAVVLMDQTMLKLWGSGEDVKFVSELSLLREQLANSIGRVTGDET